MEEKIIVKMVVEVLHIRVVTPLNTVTKNTIKHPSVYVFCHRAEEYLFYLVRTISLIVNSRRN